MTDPYQVCVMLNAAGAAVNVIRVDSTGRTVSIIWQRAVDLDEGPFTKVLESEWFVRMAEPLRLLDEVHAKTRGACIAMQATAHPSVPPPAQQKTRITDHFRLAAERTEKYEQAIHAYLASLEELREISLARLEALKSGGLAAQSESSRRRPASWLDRLRQKFAGERRGGRR